MADAIVGLVLENLSSLIQKEFSLIYRVRDNLTKLSETLSTIRDVLADAERRHITEKPIANWLMKLKHAAYDADDVLAEWLTEADQVSTSSSSCLNSKNLLFRHKMAKKIKKMLNTFEELGKQKLHFILNSGPFPEMHSQFDENRETTSLISEPRVYGRDGDKENITHMLLNNEGGETNVIVFPIVGMGGLGKTTLAQSVYNDERVERFFKPRIWVCVSEPFDIKRVLKAIIEAKENRHCDLETLEPIKNKVGEILNEKKYLLVLDDVWNEEQEKWNQLKRFLVGGAQGSSIILTTRSPKVASITSVVQPYNLEGLSDNDCWLLIKNYAFGGGNEEEHHPNLVPIGKAIAERCKGLPLVAKTLGGLLGSKTEENHWNRVKDNEIWNSKEGKENSILLALRLSYDHLPSCLKQCFAFCSIYPKDYRMERRKLINLWIANGFIQSEESKELEEIGNDTFNELVQRSFFQDAKKYIYRMTCKMHDLMHDLAVSVSLDECLAVEVGESIKHVPKTVRHLRVSDSTKSSTLVNSLLTPRSSLRTVLFFVSVDFGSFKFSNTLRVLDLSDRGITTLPPSVFHLKLLRYLDLSDNDISLLPESICKLRNLQMLDLSTNKNLETMPSSILTMQHLRYLNLSYIPFTSLPESIFMLTNLRRLDLTWNREIITLPPAIGKLVNLRHLNLRNCLSLKSIPETVCDLTNLQSLILEDENRSTKIPIGIGKLTSLRTLGSVPFILGKPVVGVGINELQRLNQLRGELRIHGLVNVRNAEEARTANLGSKQYLTKLVLSWSYDYDDDDGGRSKEVLEGLLHPHPPPNLQSLEIYEYGAEEFSQIFQGLGLGGIINRNTTLRSLTISWCKNLKSLPAELQKLTSILDLKIHDCQNLTSVSEGLRYLTSLQHLAINYCPELELVTQEEEEDCFQHLISLEKLVLDGLPQLTALPEGIQRLSMLKTLHISGCKNLASLPQDMQKLTSLTSFTIGYCDNIKCLPVIGATNNSNYISSILDLKIHDCRNLTSVSEGLRYLTSLQHLEINDCPELELVTQEEEEDCFQHLISLEKLVLGYLPQLTALPEGIQRFPMLKTLEIFHCQNLRVLPEWLMRLTTLQTLDIRFSHPDLEARCDKDKGQDWHKISHIPNVKID